MDAPSSHRPLQNLPTGLAHLEEIRSQNQVYVDKTHFIARMIETGEKYLFLSRPRWFGKSLLLSTIGHVFDKRDDLLHGTAIRESPVWELIPQCPVVTLDLLQAAADEAEGLENRLRDLIDDQYMLHGFELLPAEKPPETALRRLIQQLRARHGHNVVVLIDEYDAPVTQRFNTQRFPSAAQTETVIGQMRRFYSVLKSCGRYLQFVFLTGITRLGNAGLFSALNALWDISAAPEYTTVCGFTEEEIDRYLTPHVGVGARHLGCTPAELRNRLRHHYNGYRFTIPSEPVYNPLSCLHTLKTLGTPEGAEGIRTTGMQRPWLEVGVPYYLYQRMQAQRYDVGELVGVPAALRNTFHLGKPNIRALLFHTGFLTLKPDHAGNPQLDYPNQEVETGFKEGLLLSFSGRDDQETEALAANQVRMGQAFAEGRYEEAVECFDWLLESFTYEQLRDESHYQLLLHTACLFLPGLQPASEVRTRRGIADTVLETEASILVLEFKLNGNLGAAWQQMTARNYGGRFQAQGKRVMGIAVNFLTPRDRRGQRDARLEEWQVESRSLCPVAADE